MVTIGVAGGFSLPGIRKQLLVAPTRNLIKERKEGGYYGAFKDIYLLQVRA